MNHSGTKPPTPSSPLLRMTGIGKRFGDVSVLSNVQFEVAAGEVHVLAGENGAGKSTLIKILAGVHSEFEGRIEIDGREIHPRTPLEAIALGVAVIHQELSLIGPMSVTDNMFLGRMSTSAVFVQDSAQREKAAYWTHQLGLNIDVSQPVENYPIAVQQLIEIAKALSLDARIIVMDEPTSALNAPEVEKLFALIETLKTRGCGIIYISHKMEEIERIADRITVLRDGHRIRPGAACSKVDPVDGWSPGGGTISPPHASSGRGKAGAGECKYFPGRSGKFTGLAECVTVGACRRNCWHRRFAGVRRERTFSRPLWSLRNGHQGRCETGRRESKLHHSATGH